MRKGFFEQMRPHFNSLTIVRMDIDKGWHYLFSFFSYWNVLV